MSKEYIISVPDDAGFVEYSYIRGGRKYESHYAYRSMERLVRCGECRLGGTEDCPMDEIDNEYFCNFGEREADEIR